jgi:hypothetical protein
MAAVAPEDLIDVSSIFIETDLSTFTFMPMLAYKLVDTPEHSIIIITYSLIYEDKKTSKKIKSEINYFMSDGHTNLFRANILFPILCWSQQNIPSPDCPTFIAIDKYENCIVCNKEMNKNSVKLKPCNHIFHNVCVGLRNKCPQCKVEIKKIENYQPKLVGKKMPNAFGNTGGLLKIRFIENIDKNFIKGTITANMDKPDYIDRQSIYNKYELGDHTLSTVINPRLLNLLDLIIACSSQSISDPNLYKFLYENPKNLIPMKSMGNDNHYNLTYHNIDHKASALNRFLFINEESVLYRKSLLKTFNNIYNIFKEAGFNFTNVPIPIRSITISEFNKINSVCKNRNNQQGFNSVQNLKNYYDTSNKLYQECSPILPEEMLKENGRLTYNLTYRPGESVPIYDNILDYMNHQWTTTCKDASDSITDSDQTPEIAESAAMIQRIAPPSALLPPSFPPLVQPEPMISAKRKYLKYKQKYLILKNKLSN